jgi:hypothetical protein
MGYGRVALGADPADDVQYYVNQSNALLAQGYQTGYADFNNALIAALKANGARVATAADLSRASSFAPAAPPPPVVGPTQYLVDGKLYDTLAAAQAAAAAAPPPPPPADTGTIHYDAPTDSYLPGPAGTTTAGGGSSTLSPGGTTILVDPVPTNTGVITAANGVANDASGAGSGLSGRTLAIGAGVGLLLFLMRKRA